MSEGLSQLLLWAAGATSLFLNNLGSQRNHKVIQFFSLSGRQPVGRYYYTCKQKNKQTNSKPLTCKKCSHFYGDTTFLHGGLLWNYFWAKQPVTSIIPEQHPALWQWQLCDSLGFWNTARIFHGCHQQWLTVSCPIQQKKKKKISSTAAIFPFKK